MKEDGRKIAKAKTNKYRPMNLLQRKNCSENQKRTERHSVAFRSAEKTGTQKRKKNRTKNHNEQT